jgi:hypothetical protein
MTGGVLALIVMLLTWIFIKDIFSSIGLVLMICGILWILDPLGVRINFYSKYFEAKKENNKKNI